MPRPTIYRASLTILLFLSLVISQAASAQPEPDRAPGIQIEGEKPRLGVRIDPREFGGGVLVAGVVPGSSADRAGIEVGDRILVAHDQPVGSLEALQNILAQHAVGDSLLVQIRRGEDLTKIAIELHAPRTPQRLLRDAWLGKPLPAASIFEITGPKRKAVATTAWKGKLTLIEFWATWCGVCRKASTRLEKLAMRNPEILRVIALSSESPGHLQRWTAERKPDYRVYADSSRLLFDGLFVEMLPTFIVLDEDGIIRGAWVGYKRLAEVETFLEVAIRLRERRNQASH